MLGDFSVIVWLPCPQTARKTPTDVHDADARADRTSKECLGSSTLSDNVEFMWWQQNVKKYLRFGMTGAIKKKNNNRYAFAKY